ncbi:MAG: hypothetical protein AAFQ75_14045, partial [Pseudomonadota bacterium]
MGSRQEPLSLPPALAEAVAQVERATAPVSRPAKLHGRLEFRVAAEERLLRRSRDALTAQDIFDWIDDGPNEMPVPEVAWFLPRHLAFIATGQH